MKRNSRSRTLDEVRIGTRHHCLTLTHVDALVAMLTPILPVGADGRLELPPVCATGAPPERTETLTLAKSLAFCGDVELSLNTPLPPADASAEVLELMHSTHCWVGPLGLTTSSEPIVVDWLDKGARAVLIDPVTSSTDPTEMRTMLSALPKDRLALVVCWEGARTKQGLQAAVKEASTRLLAGGTAELTDVVGTLHVRIASPPTSRSGAAAETGAAVGELLRALGRALGVRMRLGFDGAPPSVADVGALHTLDVSAHATVALATPREQKVSMQAPASVAAAVVACARTDRSDGLLTTVVVDESGICLGLVYSSAESVQESVRVGRGVYYSRSRSSLWRKGDTSGAWQQLVAIAVDCDSDALRYTVRQHGTPPAFCHLGTRTCWGEAGGLYHLQQTLAERLKSAPAGSYTKKLFDDPTLLRHKLLEEAQVRAARGARRGGRAREGHAAAHPPPPPPPARRS